MKRYCLVVFVTAAVAASIGGLVIAEEDQDKIKADVEKARAAYGKKLSAAKAALVAQLNEAAEKHAKNAKLDDAVRVKESRQYFESEGFLPQLAEMKPAILDYGRSIKAARDELARAYELGIKAYTKAMKLEKANELTAEFDELRITSRLVSIQPHNRRTHFVLHGDFLGKIGRTGHDGERIGATFELLPGLASRDCVSLRAISHPDYFIAHGDFRIRVQKYDDSDGFRNNSTFRQVKGLAKSIGVSFESINYPGRFIRARGDDFLYVDKFDGTDTFRIESTFVITEPRYPLW